MTPPLGLPGLPLFEDSKIDLDVVDHTTVSDTPPWSPSEPQICLSLTKYKKDTTNPEVYKQAILFALKQAYQSQEKKLVIFSDSLSAVQALGELKTDHPLLIQIKDMLHKIDVDQKEIGFMWVPRHVGIRENEAADLAAK